MPKIEELVDHSNGKVRAKVRETLRLLGYDGSERSTRRAVEQVKAAWQAGPSPRRRLDDRTWDVAPCH